MLILIRASVLYQHISLVWQSLQYENRCVNIYYNQPPLHVSRGIMFLSRPSLIPSVRQCMSITNPCNRFSSRIYSQILMNLHTRYHTSRQYEFEYGRDRLKVKVTVLNACHHSSSRIYTHICLDHTLDNFEYGHDLWKVKVSVARLLAIHPSARPVFTGNLSLFKITAFWTDMFQVLTVTKKRILLG